MVCMGVVKPAPPSGRLTVARGFPGNQKPLILIYTAKPLPENMAINFVLRLVILQYSVLSLSFAQFVFEFNLHAVTTSSTAICASPINEISCETYLNNFCLRELGSSRSTDDSECPLGSSGRFGPTGNLPVSRQINSSRSWPVSLD